MSGATGLWQQHQRDEGVGITRQDMLRITINPHHILIRMGSYGVRLADFVHVDSCFDPWATLELENDVGCWPAGLRLMRPLDELQDIVSYLVILIVAMFISCALAVPTRWP